MFKDSSRAVQVSHPRSLINQQWTMKTLLCVAVLALVASTIASPLPHRAAINNHHLLDNNVRELLQLLDNIQEEKVSAEKQEEEEVATSHQVTCSMRQKTILLATLYGFWVTFNKKLNSGKRIPSSLR